MSLRSGIQIVGIALVFAIPIGLLAGFRGGGVDLVSMRIMDGVSAFPPLVLALAVVGMLGAGLSNAILAISIVVIPGFTRLIRAQTLAVRQETVHRGVSLAMGTKPGRVRRKRSCPTSRRRSSSRSSLAIGGALIAEASLSLLGFGVAAPDASWGSMINKAPHRALRAPVAGVRPERRARAHHPRVQHPRRRHPRRARPRAPEGEAGGQGPARPHHRRRRAGPGARADPRPATRASLLEVQDLSVEFVTEQGPATVVDHVSFSVAPGEVVALVGESGSGKTVTSLAVMRLVASPPGRITSGSVRLDGRDLLDALVQRDARRSAASEIAMVFQDPMTSLNPAFTIGTQLVDTIRQHTRPESQRGARAARSSCSSSSASPTPSGG